MSYLASLGAKGRVMRGLRREKIDLTPIPPEVMNVPPLSGD